jgi:hypothetical protein
MTTLLAAALFLSPRCEKEPKPLHAGAAVRAVVAASFILLLILAMVLVFLDTRHVREHSAKLWLFGLALLCPEIYILLHGLHASAAGKAFLTSGYGPGKSFLDDLISRRGKVPASDAPASSPSKPETPNVVRSATPDASAAGVRASFVQRDLLDSLISRGNDADSDVVSRLGSWSLTDATETSNSVGSSLL